MSILREPREQRESCVVDAIAEDSVLSRPISGDDILVWKKLFKSHLREGLGHINGVVGQAILDLVDELTVTLYDRIVVANTAFEELRFHRQPVIKERENEAVAIVRIHPPRVKGCDRHFLLGNRRVLLNDWSTKNCSSETSKNIAAKNKFHEKYLHEFTVQPLSTH